MRMAPIAADRTKAGSGGTEAPGKLRVVCGLTIIDGDRALDPKIRIVIPADGIDHKIRRISPPVCTE